MKAIVLEIKNVKRGPLLKGDIKVSKALSYHIKNNTPLEKNVFLPNTKSFKNLMQECLALYNDRLLDLTEQDLNFVKTNIL